MTITPAATGEMDHLDQLGAKAFDGFLVRKYSRQYPVPTYVVEFLLSRYCASTDPAASSRPKPPAVLPSGPVMPWYWSTCSWP